jgi:ribosomal protein S14
MVSTGGVEKLMLGRGRREDAEKAAVTTTTRASGHAQQRCEGDGAQLFSLRLHVARLSRNYFRLQLSAAPHYIPIEGFRRTMLFFW